MLNADERRRLKDDSTRFAWSRYWILKIVDMLESLHVVVVRLRLRKKNINIVRVPEKYRQTCDMDHLEHSNLSRETNWQQEIVFFLSSISMFHKFLIDSFHLVVAENSRIFRFAWGNWILDMPHTRRVVDILDRTDLASLSNWIWSPIKLINQFKFILKRIYDNCHVSSWIEWYAGLIFVWSNHNWVKSFKSAQYHCWWFNLHFSLHITS